MIFISSIVRLIFNHHDFEDEDEDEDDDNDDDDEDDENIIRLFYTVFNNEFFFVVSIF